MNPPQHPPDWSRDPRLDLLVDGELTPDQYRRLLRELEQYPDGWKHCALAFLQAQAWKSEFSAVVSPAAKPSAALPQAAPKTPFPWSLPLAMAASFLAAFALTWGLRGPAPSPGPEEIAKQPTPQQSTPRQPEPPPPIEPPISPEPWGQVILTAGDSQTATPVYEASEENIRAISQPPSPPPQAFRQELLRRGRRADWKRRWLQLQTPEGQHIVIPMDELEIAPLRPSDYQ